MSLAEAMRRSQEEPDGAVNSAGAARADGETHAKKKPVGINPVAYTIQNSREKTRGWLDDGTVEWQAKRLHAESSFTSWERLSETDKEVWYYLARLELMGDPAAARERRARGV